MRFVDTPAAQVQVARDESRFSIGIPMRDVSFRTMVTTMERVIDTRPCESFAAGDADWGEGDSLANVPRRKQPSFVRAMSMTEGPGDA